MYLYLVLLLFGVTVGGCFFYEGVTGRKVNDKLPFGFATTLIGVVAVLLINVIIEVYVETNVNKYHWEAVYDKAYPIVINEYDDIRTFTDERGDFYRFTVVNKDKEYELIVADAEDIDKIVICGVKPYYIPVKEYRCMDQPKFYTWFGFVDKITIKSDRHVGKLIIDEDFNIDSYKYELVKVE